MIEFVYQVNPEIYLLGESSMNKKMLIINASEESASEFACKFSACQQEVMSHVGESDPFMAVHKWADFNNLHSDSNEEDLKMCSIISNNAKSGISNNHLFEFRNKFHAGSAGLSYIDTCIVMLCPIGSNKPCFIYLDKTDASDSVVLANSEQAYLLTRSSTGKRLIKLSEFHILSYSMNTVFKIESGLFTSFSSSEKNVCSEFIQSDSLGPLKNLFLSLWKANLKEKSQK